MRKTRRFASFALAACMGVSLLANVPAGTVSAAEPDTAVETENVAESVTEEAEVIGDAATGTDATETSEADFRWDGTKITEYIGTSTEVVIPSKCTEIGDNAFLRNWTLESIVIPEGVTKIGECAFADCRLLKSMKIPASVTEIGKGAFSTTSLVSVEIPEGVTTIADSLFETCYALKSVTIPDSVTEIERDAFKQCALLDNVIIPDSVTAIGRFAFGSCINLKKITIPGGIKSIEYQTFSGCTKLETVELKEGVTSIGEDAFKNCTNLTNVILPSSLITIENDAFYDCAALKTVVIPDGVQKIEPYAFSSCDGLKEIKIPKSVTEMRYAFPYCDSLTSIVVDNDNPVYDSRNNCNAVIDKKTNMLVAGCKNTVITEGVKIIGEGAFLGLAELTSVTIPYGVTEIQDCAFWRSGITSVSLPESVTVIRREAFSECNNLENITIPKSVKVIEYKAFSDGAFSEITIPEGVTSIEDWTFMGCNNLKNISISNSVISIGREAFEGCKNLLSITIPKSVTAIASNAFSNSGLKTIRGYSGSYAETYAKKNGYTFVDLSAPAVPTVTNVKAVPAGKNKVNVTWNKVTGATGYIVYAKKNGNYAKLTVTTATTYTDIKALDNDYNFYFVYAYKKDSTGKIVVGKCQKYAYAKGTCKAVTNLKASSVKGGVKVTWTKSADADGYIVYGKRPGGTYGYVGMTSKNTSTSYTDTKADKKNYNFYWVFPYHNKNGKRVIGPICGYVYGKAK